jgi:hypothetical protein
MRCLGLEVSMAQQEAVFARDGYLHQSPSQPCIGSPNIPIFRYLQAGCRDWHASERCGIPKALHGRRLR